MTNTKKAFLIALFAAMSAVPAIAQQTNQQKVKKPSKKEAKAINAEIMQLQKDSVNFAEIEKKIDIVLEANTLEVEPLLYAYETQSKMLVNNPNFAIVQRAIGPRVRDKGLRLDVLYIERSNLLEEANKNSMARDLNIKKLEEARAKLNGEFCK